jgi:hypothetical protein
MDKKNPNGLYLTQQELRVPKSDLAKSKQHFPTALNKTFCFPGGGHPMRGIDWISLVSYILPALLVPLLGVDAATALMAFIKVVQRTQLMEIDDIDLDELDSDLDEWNDFIKKNIADGIVKNSFSTPNHHYLQHITATIKQLGPLRLYSTRCMERTIGEYKKDTGINASNVLHLRSAIHFLMQHQLLDNENVDMEEINNGSDSMDEGSDDSSSMDEYDDDSSSMDEDSDDSDDSDSMDEDNNDSDAITDIRLSGKIQQIHPTNHRNPPQLQHILPKFNNNQLSSMSYSNKLYMYGTLYSSGNDAGKTRLVFFIEREVYT